MGFKQPRVPEYRENESMGKYLKSLVLFLKDFCNEVWITNRNVGKTIDNVQKGVNEISYPVTSVNKKTGDVTLGAADVGARPNTWLPTMGNLASITKGTWNGNSTPNDIPGGITYVDAGAASDGHGFPASYITCLAVKVSVHRTFQMLIEKSNGKMKIRSSTDATTWGNWQNYLPVGYTYPVGAIYLSTASTSPASLFGGTWEQIQNRFLLAAGSSYAAGATGGAATHVLTIDQMPAHQHSFSSPGGSVASGGSLNRPINETSYSSDHTYQSSPRGGGKAHNNMPPYLAVYMWKRIA